MTTDDPAGGVNGRTWRPDRPPPVAPAIFEATGTTQLSGYNRAHAPRPALVVAATNATEVAAAVRYAAERRRSVAVQCTGHGLVDEALGSVLIDTHRMRALTVDPHRRTATVAAGVVWSDVIQAAAPHGLAPLNGSFPGVGVMGFTLGGGLGPMARAYGFAADHVREVELVTADGRLRRINEKSEPELFWGVRGGKGNFGVATEMEFSLVPVAALHGGGIYYRAESAVEALHTYRTWTSDLPEEITTSIALLRMPPTPEIPEPLRGRFVVHLRVAYLGDRRAADSLLAPLRKVGGILVDQVRDMPYTEIASIHNDPPDPSAFWERSAMLSAPSEGDIDALLRIAGPEAELPLAMVELRHLGGAVRRPPTIPNAVGNRNAEFVLLALGYLTDENTGTGFRTDELTAAGERVMGALAACDTGGTLLNFQGTATAPEQVRRAFDPDSYTRLRRLKQIHDPDHVFGFGHVIPAGIQE
ncbi:FAD-binding oxidoreductase [Streptomyces sp. NPDC059076]|uniref:FAD-binding oxidoreductase n=1 Tax=unclassified Streptomyces TaxID=2593676 RepID=UPI00367A3ECD